MTQRIVFGLALVPCLVIGLIGCSGPTEEVTTASAEMSAQQKELLAGDRIGPDEYQKAEASYSKCVRDTGATLSEQILNPLDNRRFLAIITPGPGGEDASTVDSKCQIQEISYVEVEYLKQNPPFIDPVLLQAIFHRLDQEKISYTGQEKSYGDFFPVGADTDARHNEVDRIIQDTTMELYPNLPYVAMGY